LHRRGLTLAAGSLIAPVADGAAPAAVPVHLMQASITSGITFAAGDLVGGQAAILAEGGLKAMRLTKLKVVAAVLLALGMAAAGLGIVAHRVPAAQSPAEPPQGTEKQAAPPPGAKMSEAELQARAAMRTLLDTADFEKLCRLPERWRKELP